MPTSLTRAQHLEGLRTAALAFVRCAERAGLDAPVPTCPDWRVLDLVAHQGMVHRWATASLEGRRADPDALEAEGRAADDPLGWLADGVVDLAGALTRAPEDVRTVVFLNGAPAPREFWARRQCHETTVHAVDALAASLGRRPRAEETWLDPALAVDGVDELLRGFLTRNTSRLRAEEPVRIRVRCLDGPRPGTGWVVDVSAAPPVVRDDAEAGPGDDADVVLEAGAVALYLALWNRGDEVDPRGGGWDELWSEAGIRWS